jgi:alkanesulfonate monooxygenase SsuD/methylene tetrahydromethanopterin reductase-like flavin-dependent oxidoreductase (luciferase family)
MARAAEGVGFDSIWVGDHLLYRGDGGPARGPWEAWTMLAALAAATERVELGPLVACTAFHPPGLIAKMAATIAEVSSGRFVLGLGAGWNEEEFRAFGLPFDHRVSRFEEAFTIIRGLLAGERVTLRGRYVQAEDAVLLPSPAAPPRLMIGTNGPRMLTATLPHVDAWNTWYEDYGNSPDGFATLNERISAAARDAGREPAEIVRSACALVSLDASSGERASTPDAPPPVTGPADRIASALRELHDAGADEIILVVDPITETAIRQLGEVVPRVRGG